MLQRGKRIAALGALLGASWVAYGFPVSPQRQPQGPASQFLLPVGSSGLPKPPVDVVFDLMRARGRSMKLTPRVRHVYRVHLKANRLLRIIVEQRGIDVRLEVFSPANRSLFVVDSQSGAIGPEPILLVSEDAGIYQIVVSTEMVPSDSGRYLIESAEAREAGEQDRLQASSFREYYQATDLLRKNRYRYSAEFVARFEAAAKSLDSSRSAKSLRADAWFDLGKAYAAQSRWRESVEAYVRSVELYRAGGNKSREAIALNEEAQGEQNLLRIDRCIYHFKRAIAVAQAAGNRSIEAHVLTSLGLFYAERAQSFEAERYLPRAILLSQSLHDEESESKALNAMGKLYVGLGDYDAALKIYKDEVTRLHLEPPQEAVVLTQIGNLYVYKEVPQRSFQYYGQALALQRSAEDSLDRAATLVGLGLAYSKVGDSNNAVASYRRALEIYGPRRDLKNQAIAYLNLGWTLGEMDRHEQAADSFHHALLFSRQLENSVLEAGALTGTAWIEQRRGNLVEAQREGEKALDLIESVRSRTEEMEQRLYFLATKQRVYELLVDILMTRHEDEDNGLALLQAALQVSERSKARVLIDKVRLREDESLRDQPKNLTLRDVQERALDSNTALLEYSLGERQSFLWFVTRREIQSFRLPPKAEIEALAKDVYQCMVRTQIRGKRAEAIAKARELSKMLLGPVADRLGDKRLLIVASGAVLSIPFAAFPDPAIPPGGWGNEDSWPTPLIVRHEIISEPSASALVRIRATAADHRLGKPWIALIADAVFSASDERVSSRFRGRGSDDGLPESLRLRASSSEVESISKELPTEQVRKFLGFEASRSLFLKGYLNGASVIHIATHSSIPSEHPEDAAIVLSLVDSRGRQVDGSLGVDDIGALDLQAQLVVLSSCRSAIGPNVPGEGFVGLPQAFLSAGASSVVTSLWDVDDKRTSALMARFYRHLLGPEAMSVSGALRAAQIEMWRTNSWNAPWFWAGFVAQGEWNFQSILLNKKTSRVSPQDGDPGRPGANKRNPSPPPRR